MNSAEPLPISPAVDLARTMQVARLPIDGAARDAYVAGRLVTAYALCEQLALFCLQVEVKDGVVTLAGAVDDKVLRDLALEIAQDLDGVREVRSELAIEIGAARQITPGDAFARRFDNAQLAARVKTRLLWNGATHAARIDVRVDNGTVTLTGTVANQQTRELAGQLAADVRGTMHVDNRLQLRTGS